MQQNTKLFICSMLVGIISGGTILSRRIHKQQLQPVRTITICPENTIFVFDFHDVLVTRKYISIAGQLGRIAWNSPDRWPLLKLPFSGSFKTRFKTLEKELGSSDFALEKLAEEYPELDKLLPKILYTTNTYRIIPGMEPLLKNLKQQGFKIYLASNIGPRSYTITRNKYPQLFYTDIARNQKLFDGAFVVGKRNRNGNVFTHTQKPSDAYFQSLLTYIAYKQIPDTMHIIFVDDRPENINAAQTTSSRFEGIRFTSCAQFKQTLTAKGILV